MAGYGDNELKFLNPFSNNNIKARKQPSRFYKTLKKISQLGMYYDDLIIKQSQAIGTSEALLGSYGYMPEDFLYTLALSDIGQKQYIGYFDKSLVQRRENLREFSQNGEIDFVLETIADECIIYDTRNYFCQVDVSNLRGNIKEDIENEIIDYINDSFKKIYMLFNFNKGHDAWAYFKQFLIDGFLAFEIIWDDDAENIIGFKEIDPLSIRPGIIKDENGKIQKVWYQYEDIIGVGRTLYDSQIIYISYAKSNFTSRISYVERLVRSFNLLRILENSRIIWNIMNSSFRMKTIIPVGDRSPQKQKEAVAEFISTYKEDITIDDKSGEISVNGKPSMQFYKNYVMPSTPSGAPEIEVMENQGFDLSDTEALKYFYNKFKLDTKIPFERFGREDGGGLVTIDINNTNREEIRFANFKSRLISIFQEIILKPLILQIEAKYPDLKDDVLFRSLIGLQFNEEDLFKELKEMEIMGKRVEFITQMNNLVVNETNEDGMSEQVPFFDMVFLSRKYLKMSEDDLKRNQLYIQRRKNGEDPITGKKIDKSDKNNNEDDNNKENDEDKEDKNPPEMEF